MAKEQDINNAEQSYGTSPNKPIIMPDWYYNIPEESFPGDEIFKMVGCK